MKRMHVMLIRFSSLGDVVIQTSVINWLHQNFGTKLKITFVTSREFQDLVAGHPLVDRVVSFDRRSGEKLSGLVKKLKLIHEEDPFTFIFDLHATTRSWLLRLMMNSIPRLVVDKRRILRTLLVRLPGVWIKRWTKWKILGLEPQVIRTPKDFQGILLSPFKEIQPMTFTPAIERVNHPRPYVVFAPVASFAAKRWPIEYYLSLAQLFLERTKGIDLVIVAGPEDHHCQAFNVIADERLINLQGKTKLKESMAWMQGAVTVVGNDSGMNHVAETGDVPVITLFGPTHEAFGFAPHLKNSTALSKNLWCRPCSTTGSKNCFRDKHYCMTELNVETVWEALLQRINQV
ncbi:MAG: glycosyltransferase family 9 protein [Bacteriovoracaceae bacterium]|nr:glycosyltransferase family 9 protein [Bacteriovoracaceae bacterium]